MIGIFCAMWLEIESLEKFGLWGMAGGVSFLQEDINGKHIIKTFSDMSYVK